MKLFRMMLTGIMLVGLTSVASDHIATRSSS